MSLHHLPITFSVPKNGTLDTIESVLAIARRGGLQLDALEVQRQAALTTVYMRVSAAAPEPLELFVLRAQNLVDIIDVERILNQAHMVDLAAGHCRYESKLGMAG